MVADARLAEHLQHGHPDLDATRAFFVARGAMAQHRAELARDGAVSVAVGSGGYLFGAWQGLDPMLLGVSLLLSGYGGARVLSAGADRLLEAIRGRRGQEG